MLVLVASISHLELTISYRVIDQPSFLMRSYSQAFFPTEISNVIFADTVCLLVAGNQSTLIFKMYKKRDKFYEKYLRDEFLFKRITIIHLTIENPKNV